MFFGSYFYKKNSMDIQIQHTQTPNIVKFVCPKTLTKDSFEYHKQTGAANSPLAGKLLQFPFIQKVYISGDFIAVEKNETVEWDLVKDELSLLIGTEVENDKVFLAQEKLPYSLYAEITPNPNVMKFVSNKLLLEKGQMVEIKSEMESKITTV
ncbi:MAG: hypothetical protein C4K58_08575 [Flavobacteriaceae bacterium]|nr:MAG: hypothetical protein C4K58_08575 [Flavobacteriaceae bacterium]